MKRKAVLTALAIAIVLNISSANAIGEQTVSLGYTQGNLKLDKNNSKDVKVNDDLKGINLKYRYELDDVFGALGSFSYSKLGYDYYYSNIKIADASFDYYSIMIGPTVRFNEFLSLYALLGAGHGKIQASILGFGGKKEETSLAYGIGMQFNPVNNIAIDASYEYTKFKDANLGSWVLGVGYRF